MEKVTAVFRALPKALRKPLVPVPDHAREALVEIGADVGDETGATGVAGGVSRTDGKPQASLPGFHEWLAQWVTRRAGAPVTAAELAALALPDYLRINIRVVDAKVKKEEMSEGRREKKEAKREAKQGEARGGLMRVFRRSDDDAPDDD